MTGAAFALEPLPGHAALDLALASARPGDAITLPAPLAAPASLLGAAVARADAAIWEPRPDSDHAWSIAGAGIAAELRASGPARFADLVRSVEYSVPPGGVGYSVPHGGVGYSVPHGGVGYSVPPGVPAPRWLGGFAFTPGSRDEAFPDARFVLPRWTYARRGEVAWLTAIVDATTTRDGWHGELADVLAALAAAPAIATPRVIAVREADPAQWRQQVEEIRAAIARGACAKIVAARTCEVELASSVDAAIVLRRLGERHPECARFAIRAGGRVFLGATPERLVALTGREVACDALAGSIARRGDDVAERAALLASAKDRGEHDLVVRAIGDALAPLCARLDVPAQPQIRTLRHVHHLHTPVRGTLAARRHVVELAGALHPTPAVAGVPTADALGWIATREPTPRGWYGAPVGWFDADGDGELVVAIRSAMLDGRHARLHAGAGIVAGSDPDLELDETRVKLRAVLGALGAST